MDFKSIIKEQREELEKIERKEMIIERERLKEAKSYLNYPNIVVITGIRRCGKSSLLKIISEKLKEDFIYITFDDIRLSDFDIKNFEDIGDIVAEIHGINTKVTYLLDEIQNVPSWERWVNNLFTREIKVFVTGSNSSLLSSEISTFLTGRNKIIRLYPFSFKEFLLFKHIKQIINFIELVFLLSIFLSSLLNRCGNYLF